MSDAPQKVVRLRVMPVAECSWRDDPRTCERADECRYHILHEMTKRRGLRGIKTKRDEELLSLCSLQLADLGAMTLEEVGDTFRMSRSRVEQIEKRALEKLRVVAADILERASPAPAVQANARAIALKVGRAVAKKHMVSITLMLTAQTHSKRAKTARRKWIRILNSEHGLDGKQIADAIGFDHGTVCQWLAEAS